MHKHGNQQKLMGGEQLYLGDAQHEDETGVLPGVDGDGDRRRGGRS